MSRSVSLFTAWLHCILGRQSHHSDVELVTNVMEKFHLLIGLSLKPLQQGDDRTHNGKFIAIQRNKQPSEHNFKTTILNMCLVQKC